MNLQMPIGMQREFEHHYPTPDTAQSVHDEQDLQRAVEAYRFFYPTVSAEALFNGTREIGIDDGEGLIILAAGPRHVVFTANSDTPYASGTLDLGAMGAVVVELPPGPFIGLADDHNQRWIIDMGIPGPDGGRGGKYLLLPPGYRGSVPPGYFIAQSPTYKLLLALRALPNDGGARDAFDALRQIKVYPLSKPETVLPFVDITNRTIDNTPLRWEDNLEYWRRLHAVIDSEPALDEYRPMYGELAALGIEKGRRFEPDAKMRDILESAAKIGRDQMLVEGFASQRSDRQVWSDRRWEWVGLTPDDANFEAKDFIDLQARERWFIQAIIASPAMFRRKAGSGSVYFLAARDASGAYLDGGRAYKLRVPQPVPAKMFWSVTAYDAGTRSQVQTPQNRAVINSLGGELERNPDGTLDLYFGPRAPEGKEQQWVRTAPGTGFFLYFRIYGPEAAALDGSWRLGDVSELGVPGRRTADAMPWADTLESISTPDMVHTPIGALHFQDGIPAAETAANVYDHVDRTHAYEAFLNSFQAVSLYAARKGFLDAGIADNDVLLFSKLMDSKSLFLTANCDTVYFVSFLDLTHGPLLVDVPPGVLGTVDDMWFRFICDVGLPGPDRGEGGKYLFLPPGYTGPVPEGGVFVERATTNRAILLGRAFLENDDPAPAVARIKQALRIRRAAPGAYGSSIASFLQGKSPLAMPGAAAATRFVEGSGLAINTIPPNDMAFYEMLDASVQLDSADVLDPELAGQFAALGIVKGKPFRPDARMHQILTEAAALANAAARTLGLCPRDDEGFKYYDTRSSWVNPLFVGGYEFLRPPPAIGQDGVHAFPNANARTLNARTAFFYIATGITPAMCMRLTGLGSQYLAAMTDGQGRPFDGRKTYKLVLPPNIPAAKFWSLTLYDNQTRSMLQTPQRFPRAGSQNYPTPAARPARDGSTTIYIGPQRLDRVEPGNWIQSVPGKGWFIALRLYNPLAAFFDKTWRPSEIEAVD